MNQPARFVESSGDSLTAEREALLRRTIRDLGLKIEGTRLETIVAELYHELDAAGIQLKPQVYLSDEWGCPEGVPIIGIPFYLADEKLSRLEDEFMEGIEAESDEEILRYLRHEAGHAFNYAYKLFESEEWHQLFGPYSRPYRDDYQPNPFSRNFVRHIAGWYAQKHPDEDFAETFAVWLAPKSNWRQAYADWGCFAKLEYVDRVIHQLGHRPPLVTSEGYDTAGDLSHSIAEHYQQFRQQPVDVPAYFDGDLRDLFEVGQPPAEGDSWTWAADFLRRRRRFIIKNIAYWTGLSDTHVRSLINHFIDRCQELHLWLPRAKAVEVYVELIAYATTLCMNRLYKGDYVSK